VTGCHINNKGVYTSEGKVRTEPPYLDWLIEQIGGEPAWFYHLDANVASLLHLIGITENEAKRLLGTHKLYIAPYKMSYYLGKFFSVDKGAGALHPYANFYNAGQYLATQFDPNEEIFTAVEKAKATAYVGEQVVKVLHKLGLDTSKLVSPVSALDSRLKALSLTTIDDIPPEAGEFAYGCVKGNWLEAFAWGYWK